MLFGFIRRIIWKLSITSSAKVSCKKRTSSSLPYMRTFCRFGALEPSSGIKVASLADRAADLQMDYLKDRFVRESKSLMAYPVSVGVEGEAILSDFCDSNTCHVLVAGTAGSGKSEWLKTLVARLVHRNPPQHRKLALGA